MTKVRRLKAVSAVFGLVAVATCTHVFGEPSGDKAAKPNSLVRPDVPAAADHAVSELPTKFAKSPVIHYQTLAGEDYVALQVKPKLDVKVDRPRDILIMVDTAASQVRGPLQTALKLTQEMVNSARPEDRVAIWTINTPAATQNLTRGFKSSKSAEVTDALKGLAQEVPFGGNDLKNAIDKAVSSFDNREGRSRVIVFLGSGKSILNPVSDKDRPQLCEKMTAKEIAFFPVPLGANMEPMNLHGFATGTGGLVVRQLTEESVPAVAKKLNEALATPILYTTKFEKPAAMTECYPTKLPPLRSDATTLVVGKMKKDANTLDYVVEGAVAGKDVRVKMSEAVPGSELDNYFLMKMVDQWKTSVESKEMASAFRADRALAMSFERTRLAKDEFIAQALWAIEMDRFDVAKQMFVEANKLDPRDPEADAGMKIVDKLRIPLKDGGMTKKQLQDALGKPSDPAIRINKHEVTRDRMDKMVAMAGPEDKVDAPKVPGIDPDFAPEREPLLQVQKQRQAVEEQRINGIVNEAERQARRILASDPDAAHDLLKRTLSSIRDNNDLSKNTQQALVTRLENALQNADRQGRLVKRNLDEQMRMLADAQKRVAETAERERNQETIQRRVQSYANLLNTGRFEEAFKEALVMQQDMLAKGQGMPTAVTAAYVQGITATHIKEVREIQRASEERYLLTMLQVDKSHIPFPDEPPVGFPPAATWRELTNRRKGIWDSIGLGEDSSRNALVIKDKLAKPVNLEKGIDPNTPLKDALEFLSDRYDLTMIIDSKAFEAIGVQKVEEQPVSLPKMVGVSMATVLRLLLAQIKGDVYTGTYLIRRDFIEITTTYNAAAEKVVRAYPVADLVIPIPNAVNQQALQQSLQVYGAYQNAQNPFQFGVLGGGLGALGGALGGGLGGANPFAPQQGGGLGGGFNPMGFQGQQVGNNQFGNLGGQFGLQGQDTHRQLLQLITRVVAPREWTPLPPEVAGPGQAAGGPPGLAGPDPNGEPIVPPELLNSLDYYEPARTLIVRGSSRIHTRLDGGLLGPRPGAAPAAMGALDIKRDGALVIGPKGKDDPKKDAPIVKNDPKNDKKPVVVAAPLDAKKIWTDALAKMIADPKADHTGLVIACADFLVENGKYDHAAEFLKANLRLGIVTRPWVYEALGVALQLSNGSPEDIERAQVSAVDLEPQDAKGYLRAAKAMAEIKRYDRAVAFCQQAAMKEPGTPDSYANGLVYAQQGKDPQAMAWAASNLLKQDWTVDNQPLHLKAQEMLNDLSKVLAGKPEASRVLADATLARERDLVITLSWQGEADLDLKIKEPINTVCSYMNKQTPNGGTLLGDDLLQTKKQYIAAQAFTGKYEITVERLWGRPTGAKAVLEIVRHQGTPQERLERQTVVFDRTQTIIVTLDDGRRTTVATVPPPASSQRSEREDKVATPDMVLNKLRALSDPNISEMSGMRGSIKSAGIQAPKARDLKGAPAATEGKAPTYQKVQNFVNNAMEMTAQTTVNPDSREIRVKMNPVFQTSGKGAPAQSNPLIPGGF